MALQTNQRQQMIKRIKQTIKLSIPSVTVSDAPLASGEPGIMLTIASVDVAHISLQPKTFNGFNVVAELSTSAAVGFPETELFLQLDTAAAGMSYDMAAIIMHNASKLGCSSIKVIASTASPAAANAVDANVTSEIANDAILGSVGA